MRLMSLQTSDPISSHLPGVRGEMVLYFQSIEHTTVPPPKAPNEHIPVSMTTFAPSPLTSSECTKLLPPAMRKAAPSPKWTLISLTACQQLFW